MSTAKIRTRSAPVVAAVALLALLALAACGGGSGSDDEAAPGSTTTSTTTASSTVTTTASAPTSSTTPRPPSTKGPKTITYGPITFHAPSNWDIYTGSTANTAFVGLLAGGPRDVNLRVMTDYSGTVDALQPPTCNESESVAPSTVELLESGFSPVGSLNAEYRRWRFTCSNQRQPEEHAAWLLPVSHIAIVEQTHTPEVFDVVTTAEVA